MYLLLGAVTIVLFCLLRLFLTYRFIHVTDVHIQYSYKNLIDDILSWNPKKRADLAGYRPHENALCLGPTNVLIRHWLSQQASDERLHLKRQDGGRRLKSLQQVYKETKVRVATYIVCGTSRWIRIPWKREYKRRTQELKKRSRTSAAWSWSEGWI